MKRLFVVALSVAAAALIGALLVEGENSIARAEDKPSTDRPDKAAVDRARETVKMLDNIYKQTIVLVTDKYVHDEDDFPAGSAAVLLFKNISETGSHQVRLIDATGEPYEPENVAQDDFEREGIKRLKKGAEGLETVVSEGDNHYLRVVTPVPVVMEKCVMCHAHYADAKPGEPIGAISYTVPIK